MLEIKGVTKIYDTGGFKQTALNNVSINFRKSEFAAILGPSGSGKTTLLNIIGGLDHYTSGDLIISGISTKKFRDKDWDSYRNHRIGFVFQSYNLISHQTVLQNVKLALTLSGISKKEATTRATKALKDVGLGKQIHKKPNQLSGGQMQRVAIARALVNNPEILLADEPTGALDSGTSVQIMDLLKEIAKTRLVIMVTHNPDLAKEYANRIVEVRDGKIISDSNPYSNTDTTEDQNTTTAKRRKTKMSFFTALGLSFKNLLTKKGRTILVAFAGSIGIIGIALILAVSTGFQNYVDHIQEETLGSYPLIFEESSADITSVLLGVAEDSSAHDSSEKDVAESQLLTSVVNSVGVNDLKSFKAYLENHYDEVSSDLTNVSYRYSIDPLIYTVDATGTLAKLNPSNLFTSFLGGGSSVLSSYSSVTSVFRQISANETMLNTNYKLLSGNFPKNYNEVLLILPDDHTIPDFLVYSLGLRDTKELSTIMTKLLNNETVSIKNEPKNFTYDELMATTLKLIQPANLYEYNAKYDVYEDMSENASYLKNVYDQAEQLKIVGVASTTSNLSSGGIGYLPSLIDYISNSAKNTEIVQKQLKNPEIDIFSGSRFDAKRDDFDFSFSDLVSVDQAKLSQAFGMNIDQNAITAETTKYMTTIANSITTDITPAATEFDTAFDAIISDYELTGEYDEKSLYAPFMQAIITTYEQLELDNPEAEDNFATAVTTVKNSSEYILFRDTYAAKITEGLMQKTILEQVGGLTTYLTKTFAGAFHVDQDKLTSAFTLNFSKDELTRVVQAMFTKTETTQKSNLISLGYQDLADPTAINFYFASFEGKEHFLSFVDDYNKLMESYHQDDKVIEYADATGLLMDSVKTIVDAVSYVLIAFVSISLVVSSIMIGIITYISVYERTKEIGILRAIGASKRNISNIFNAETFIIGLLSGLFGIGLSYIFIPIINSVLHHFTGDIPLSASLALDSAGILIIISIILTLIGGLIPARAASKKDPVEALRTE